MVFVRNFTVSSPNTTVTPSCITSTFTYPRTSVHVDRAAGTAVATPTEETYAFKTETSVPRVGVLLVGLGGNNGTTLYAAVAANRDNISWRTKEGVVKANYLGSVVMATTTRVGHDDESGEDVYTPLRSLVPMAHPDDFVIGGWDISGANLADGMKRAQVLDIDLQRQVAPEMTKVVPMASVYYPDFIAANQSERANNLLPGQDKGEHLETIRADIRRFKEENSLETVVVLWTANTERFCDVVPGVHDSADALLAAIKDSHDEVSPSTLFAVASVLEGCPYINGSPQNTFVPGVVRLAEREGVFIGGDDFKSGQTKFKSVMVDFLISAGIKPKSIVSYNHLGNNDGRNLSAPSQFRSKEISKSSVVDDMVASNRIMYEEGQHPDHVVVIKYVPAVADSKRAMDEYGSEIFMGGASTIVTHNTCEDSLLATPLIIDLVLVCELATRITYKTKGMDEFEPFHPVLSLLSYMLKAPMTPPGMPVINALFKQRSCLENIFRACAGLKPENDMRLEHRALPRSCWPALIEAEARSKAASETKADAKHANCTNGHVNGGDIVKAAGDGYQSNHGGVNGDGNQNGQL